MNANATPSPDTLFDLATGFMASKMLFTAGAIDLFARLADGPRPAEDVAAGLTLPVRGVRVVADAMVALGLLTLEGERYANGELAQTYLAGRTAADFRPLLKFWDRLSYPAWQRLEEAVRTDSEKTGTLFDLTGEDAAIFSAGVEAATTSGAMALASSYDFGRHARVLDLGGGTGSFLKFIERQYPHISGTLFELPTTAAYARSRLTAEEARRITVVDGDLLRDAFPPGHDAFVLAHILHGFNESQNVDLFTRTREVASDGGRMLIVDFFLNAARIAPVTAALMSGEFLIQTMGRSYSTVEVGDWLADTGWRFIEHRPLAGAVSLVVAER